MIVYKYKIIYFYKLYDFYKKCAQKSLLFAITICNTTCKCLQIKVSQSLVFI